jgi:hypothetical protein
LKKKNTWRPPQEERAVKMSITRRLPHIFDPSCEACQSRKP